MKYLIFLIAISTQLEASGWGHPPGSLAELQMNQWIGNNTYDSYRSPYQSASNIPSGPVNSSQHLSDLIGPDACFGCNPYYHQSIVNQELYSSQQPLPYYNPSGMMRQMNMQGMNSFLPIGYHVLPTPQYYGQLPTQQSSYNSIADMQRYAYEQQQYQIGYKESYYGGLGLTK